MKRKKPGCHNLTLPDNNLSVPHLGEADEKIAHDEIGVFSDLVRWMLHQVLARTHEKELTLAQFF